MQDPVKRTSPKPLISSVACAVPAIYTHFLVVLRECPLYIAMLWPLSPALIPMQATKKPLVHEAVIPASYLLKKKLFFLKDPSLLFSFGQSLGEVMCW